MASFFKQLLLLSGSSRLWVIVIIFVSPNYAAFGQISSVNSLSSLEAAIANASGGEQINLLNGSYGEFSISGKNYNSFVTLKAQSDAVIFSRINIEASSNIKIDGVTIIADGREGVGIFENSHHIQILNSRIQGAEQFDRNEPDSSQVSTLYAINVDGNAHDLLIENNNASDVSSSAYLFEQLSDTIIRGNYCDWVAADCFKFSGADNILFENNFGAQNVYSPDGAHVDFVQGQGDVSNSIFRGNVAIMGSRTFQGLFFDDATFTNLLIENNLIYTANNRGISVAGNNSSGIEVRYNTVLRVFGSQKATFISLPDNSIKEFNIEANNTTKNENRFVNNGILTQWDDEDDVAHYSDYYINATHGPYATIADFEPITGSPADNQFGAFARIKELINSGTTLNPNDAPPSLDPDNTNATITPTLMLLLED